jgi:ubiquinone/menaquinone biosynthesis C-methylase UbiE
MSLKNQLRLNPFLEYKNNIFYQKDFPSRNQFEEIYIKVREKENRVYSDGVVESLPEFHGNEYQKEWRMRKASTGRLLNHLQQNKSSSILEVGCGNGWLSNNLAQALKAEVCGLDINEIELRQGARVFRAQENLSFVYADIFSAVLEIQKFDAVVLSACIQYFSALQSLIDRLLKLTTAEGKIYILDSPLYVSAADVGAAKKRTQRYYESIGFPAMAEQYLHHTYDELDNFNYHVLFSPKTLLSLFNRKILHKELPIFPMICIYKK